MLKVILQLLIALTALKSTISFAQQSNTLTIEEKIEFSKNTQFPFDRYFCANNNDNCTLGGMKKNQIALTFDDGPNSNTLQILKILKQYRIKATFFVTLGKRNYTREKQDLLNQIYSLGHKVANHGANHGALAGSVSESSLIQYLSETDNIISNYVERNDIFLYRNPGGYWNSNRANILNSNNNLRRYVGPIFWNVGGFIVGSSTHLTDAADWQCQSRKLSAQDCMTGYYNKIIRNYKNNQGSLVLMHDVHKITASLLSSLLENLSQDSINWEFILVQDIPAVQFYNTEL
jgi:peptidoglycan-N-acetylglucosamine deacetylase